MTNITTKTGTFITDNTYAGADPEADAVARAEAEARAALDPESARKPAEWQDLTGLTTVKDGAVVDIVEEDDAAEAETEIAG